MGDPGLRAATRSDDAPLRSLHARSRTSRLAGSRALAGEVDGRRPYAQRLQQPLDHSHGTHRASHALKQQQHPAGRSIRRALRDGPAGSGIVHSPSVETTAPKVSSGSSSVCTSPRRRSTGRPSRSAQGGVRSPASPGSARSQSARRPQGSRRGCAACRPPARARARAPARTPPYDLRHPFVSLLIDEGVSIVEVARQAGHSPEECLRTYAHTFEEFDPADRQREEAVIAAARSPKGDSDVRVLYARADEARTETAGFGATKPSRRRRAALPPSAAVDHRLEQAPRLSLETAPFRAMQRRAWSVAA
jgi:hypothetical protein